MRILVKRATLSTNECKEFKFTEQKNIQQFLVTNLSNAGMYADFETITDSSTQGVLIPAGGYRIVTYSIRDHAFETDKIYVKGTGLVEVQPVDF